VATVAAEEPETAAKIPQPTTFTWSSFPGSHPTQGATPLNKFSESLVRNSISPIQINNGNAASVQDDELAHNAFAIALTAGALLKRPTPSQPTVKREIDIHTPRPNKVKRANKNIKLS
jgi:hypothetical protein